MNFQIKLMDVLENGITGFLGIFTTNGWVSELVLVITEKLFTKMGGSN